MTAIIIWAIIITYLGIGARLWPRFALESYKREKSRYSALQASKAGCAGVAAIHALGWPITLATSYAVKYIDGQLQAEKERAELERQMQEELQRHRTMEKIRPRLELLAFDKAAVSTKLEARQHNAKVADEARATYYEEGTGLRRSEIDRMFGAYMITDMGQIQQ